MGRARVVGGHLRIPSYESAPGWSSDAPARAAQKNSQVTSAKSGRSVLPL